MAKTPRPLPLIWAHIQGRYWSAKIDDISLWPPWLKPSLPRTWVWFQLWEWFLPEVHGKYGPLVKNHAVWNTSRSRAGFETTRTSDLGSGNFPGLYYSALRTARYLWQFKEATRLRIYNYVKTKCGETKTRDNFDTRQHMSVTLARIRWWNRHYCCGSHQVQTFYGGWATVATPGTPFSPPPSLHPCICWWHDYE